MDTYLHAQFAEIEWTHWWFLGRRAIVQDVLARRVGRVGRALDIGCGAGAMVPVLQGIADHVTALDTAEEAVAYCRPRFPDVEFHTASVPDGLPDGPFDLVSAFDVIEHIDDDAGALAALRDVLVPGGRLVCTVPAYQWLWSAHDDLNEHKRRYTAAGLRARLEGAGFEVELISSFNTILFPVVAALRLVRRYVLRQRAPASDFDVPAPLVNRVLALVMGSERFLLRRTRLPFGVSLVAVARRIDR